MEKDQENVNKPGIPVTNKAETNPLSTRGWDHSKLGYSEKRTLYYVYRTLSK